MDKEVRKLITALERIDGVEVTATGSGHSMVTKGGEFVTTLPSTPSDHRWKENVLATLRRNGITPASSPEKLARPQRVIPMRTLAGHMRGLRDRKQVRPFARFCQQLAEVRGLRSYASSESMATSMLQVASGSTKQLTPWAWRLASQGWEEWVKRPEFAEASEKLAAATDLPPEQLASPPQATTALVIDLTTLSAKLAEFGIRIEVR